MSILGQFWRNQDTADVVQALEIEVWLDVLEPLTDDEIRHAWAEYQRSGPRTVVGELYEPDPSARCRNIERDHASFCDANYRLMLEHELSERLRAESTGVRQFRYSIETRQS